MTNVVDIGGVTTLDLDPDRVLEKAKEDGLDSVIIAGYTKDGDEYFASSYADGGTTLWLLERMKLELLRMADSEDA